MNTHKCSIPSCQTDVSATKLMCVRHWRMVPGQLQRYLYATWDHGRGAGTQQHLDVMLACINAVTEHIRGALHDNSSQGRVPRSRHHS